MGNVLSVSACCNPFSLWIDKRPVLVYPTLSKRDQDISRFDGLFRKSVSTDKHGKAKVSRAERISILGRTVDPFRPIPRGVMRTDMKKSLFLIVALIVPCLLFCTMASAQQTVRWSAPMDVYPNPWSPTQAPPVNNQYYNGQDPYDPYGYWSGQAPQHAPWNQSYLQPRATGNPYYPSYGY